jgi:hypothetical protein
MANHKNPKPIKSVKSTEDEYKPQDQSEKPPARLSMD